MCALKIALLSRWYAEEHRRTGGTGAVQELAEAVAALGHEVVVLSQSKSVAKLEKTKPGELGALEVWLSPRQKRIQGRSTVASLIALGQFLSGRPFAPSRS